MSEIATVETESRALRPMLTKKILDQETEQRKLLGQYITSNMTEGTDYGVIPGTKDRTLLKPGAEKLTDLFRCTPEYTFVERTEDFEKPLFHYLIHCKVVSRESGTVIAEGFGSCNSREGKYRWRNEDRKCPDCDKPAIMRSKFPPRDEPDAAPGWYCYAKKGGCGANFDAADPAIIGQSTGRVENDDVATIANTLLKMAKKRALVDAALGLARCSDMFTQDVEDFADAGGPAKTPDKPKAKPVENVDPPDKVEVDECLAAMNECRNREELKDVAARYAANAKITPEGKAHLKAEYVRRWKELPKAIPVNEDSEPPNDHDVPH